MLFVSPVMTNASFPANLTPILTLLLAAVAPIACGGEAPPIEASDASSEAADAGTDASDATDAGSEEDAGFAPDVDPVPPIACGTALPGPPLGAVTEAEGGYADQLAAVDLSRLPDAFDYSAETPVSQAVINYMLGRPDTRVTREEAMAAGPLGLAVVAAFAQDGGGLDFGFLRRGLYHFYLCARPVPGSLTELRARFGDYSLWPSETIDCSKPKDGPRRIHRDDQAGVYVAETLLEGGEVRETEVIFTKLRADGQLDFAAYTQDGALTDRSTFATATSQVVAPAPYTCMSCHYDRESVTFSRQRPTGTGAGCR